MTTTQRIATLRADAHFEWFDVSLSDTSWDDLRDALGLPERAFRALQDSGDVAAGRTVIADRESVVFELHCYVDCRPIRVRVVVTDEYLVTVHDERTSLPAVLALKPDHDRTRAYVAYSVLDAILESTFSALDEVGRNVEALAADGRVARGTLRESVATLAAMRRWVTAEQAVLERVAVEIGALRGFGTGDRTYFDRLGEQVNHLLASIDAVANGLGMLLDVQLNERAFVVSALATIFVPLTLITGYFGMNFGWMVDRIDGPTTFWLLGLVLPIATGALSWRFVVRPFLTGGGPKS